MPYDLSDLPDGYARQYLHRAQTMYNGPEGQYARAFAPSFLPGVPAEIVLAFIAPGYQTSDTTEGTSAQSQEVPFRELGLYQTPGGARGGPSPAPGSAYYNLASDPTVMQVLGRRADTSQLAWRGRLDDQTAIGLADLRNNYAAATSRMDPRIKPSAIGTPWGAWTAFGAFSAGPAAMAELASHYADKLAAVDEAHRPGALVNAMALDVQNRVPMGGAPDRHSTLAHRVLRNMQKFRLAQALAQSLGDANGASYFDLGLGDQTAAHDDLVLRGNWHMAPGDLAVTPLAFPPPGSGGSGGTGGALLGGGLFALLVLGVWKWLE